MMMAAPGHSTVQARIPTLPFELERDIFELTARTHRGSAITLILVARRVQIWIEALIYKKVVLDFPLKMTARFLRTLDVRKPSFFADHVTTLCLTSIITFDQASRILSVCNGVVDLTCWVSAVPPAGLLPLIHAFPLRRLSVKLESLLEITPEPDFSHPIFRHLTHLDIVNPPCLPSPIDWSGLYLLPNITHLAFGDLFAGDHSYMVHALPALLANCESLRALVITSDDPSFRDELKQASEDDSRLLFLPSFHHPHDLMTYWEGLRRGDLDFWTRTDKIVG